jgi:hypothetical protein
VKKSETESAQAVLVQILSQEGYNTETVASMSAVASCITPERAENYNHEIIALVRSRNMTNRERITRRESVRTPVTGLENRCFTWYSAMDLQK